MRWKRMSGFNTLWLPGHRPRRHRHADGGGAAARQGRQVARRPRAREVRGARLGVEGAVRRPRSSTSSRASAPRCDWTRERFTLDAGLSRAVREVFVQLYEDGLIYRGIAMVNWCPRCRTAISDLEVETQTEPAASSTTSTIRRRTASRGHRGGHDASGDDARRHRAWPCIPTTSATSDLIGKTAILPIAQARDPDRRRRPSSTASSAPAS